MATEAGVGGVKKQSVPWQVPGGEVESEELRCLVADLLGPPFSVNNVALVPSTSLVPSLVAIIFLGRGLFLMAMVMVQVWDVDCSSSNYKKDADRYVLG